MRIDFFHLLTAALFLFGQRRFLFAWHAKGVPQKGAGWRRRCQRGFDGILCVRAENVQFTAAGGGSRGSHGL